MNKNLKKIFISMVASIKHFFVFYVFLTLLLLFSCAADVFAPPMSPIDYWSQMHFPRDPSIGVIVWDKAHEYGLNRDFVAEIIYIESQGKWWARSSVGAIGLMQIMPATARILYGKPLNDSWLYNAEFNVNLGCKYLRHLIDRYDGDIVKVVIAYNAGAGWIHWNIIPTETAAYLSRMVRWCRENEWKLKE